MPQQRGKGCAVRTAMLAATGSVVAFTDADLPYDLEAVPYISELINRHAYDVVVGDRTLPESTSSPPVSLRQDNKKITGALHRGPVGPSGGSGDIGSG